MDPEFIHAEEVKEITGLTVAALSQMRYRGIGSRSYKPIPRTVLYKRSEVIAWIEASTRATA